MRRLSRVEKLLLVGGLLLHGGVSVAQQPPAPPASAAAAPATAAAPAAAAAAAPAAAAGFTREQLEQLVAPIALYPDALLTQVFMASTYPLEIVEAARFMKKNAGLEGSKLEEAIKPEDWDPSVKSICAVPEVLARMNDNLDWTQDLGDAVLGQQTELLDAVQSMRGKAYDSGNLKTTEQQTVTVQAESQQPDIIVIQSPEPEVIYVPTYSPTVVYGGWGYPSYYYPGMYPYYPPGAGFIGFTAGVIVGGAIWGNCNWGWGHSDIDIDVNRYNNFNRNTSINADRNNLSGDRATWNHNAEHRKGVNYKDGATASKYGGSGASNRVSSQEARGRGEGASGTRDGAGAASLEGAAAGTRGGASTADRAGAGTRDSAASRPSSGASSSRASGSGASSTRSSSTRSGSSYGGSGAYSGSRSGSMDRAASSRGSMSRSSAGMSRGGGRRR